MWAMNKELQRKVLMHSSGTEQNKELMWRETARGRKGEPRGLSTACTVAVTQ